MVDEIFDLWPILWFTSERMVDETFDPFSGLLWQGRCRQAAALEISTSSNRTLARGELTDVLEFMWNMIVTALTKWDSQ